MTRQKIKAGGMIRWFSNESDHGFFRTTEAGIFMCVGSMPWVMEPNPSKWAIG